MKGRDWCRWGAAPIPASTAEGGDGFSPVPHDTGESLLIKTEITGCRAVCDIPVAARKRCWKPGTSTRDVRGIIPVHRLVQHTFPFTPGSIRAWISVICGGEFALRVENPRLRPHSAGTLAPLLFRAAGGRKHTKEAQAERKDREDRFQSCVHPAMIRNCRNPSWWRSISGLMPSKRKVLLILPKMPPIFS